MKTIRVTNYLGETLEIDLANPYEHGLAITRVDGIGAAQAQVNIGEYASSDGGYYNSARALTRNIIIDITYLHAPSIEDARHRSYKFFPIKKEVTLEFISEERQCVISGLVESNEAVVFALDTTTTISILCPQPYFQSIDYIMAYFFGEKPLFHFPFSNDSVISKRLVMGDVRHQVEEVITYMGEAESGFIMRIDVKDDVKNLVIYNTITTDKMHIMTDKILGGKLIAGDQIVIDTRAGTKSMFLLRDGRWVNILNSLSRDSDWFLLTLGENIFSYTASEGADDLNFTIEYYALYEGV